VVRPEGGAEGAAGVAGRGLDPEALEDAVAQQATVGDAVERDAAGEAEVFLAGPALHVPGHAQHDFFGHHLDAGGKVHLALRQGAFGLAGGPPNRSWKRGWSWSGRRSS